MRTNTAPLSAVDRWRQKGKTLGEFLATSVHGIAYQKDCVRCLAQEIGWTSEQLIAEVCAYDKERLEAVPSLTTYPELRGCRDQMNAYDEAVLACGVAREILAVYRTMGFYRDTKLYQQFGKAFYAETTPEKCRVLYVPESDVGMIHAKNVDDPDLYFKPAPLEAPNTPWPWGEGPIYFDGVGSGLHIDEIPPEIFPVNPHELCKEHCTTVPAATEFMVRYNYFWRGGNLLIHDMQGNSMAFEKTSCRVATRGPNKAGVNFITGMGALDPGIAGHIKAMRQKYLDQIGHDWTGPDGCFWKISEQTWANMAAYVEEFSKQPTLQRVNELLERRDPSGPMCLTGEKGHPDQPVAGWTLIMYAYLFSHKQMYRRQVRNKRPAFLDTPEFVQYV